jgi:hypothetical protein
LKDYKKNRLKKSKREEEKSRDKLFGTENLKILADKLSLSKINIIDSQVSNVSSTAHLKDLISNLMEEDIYSFISYLEEVKPVGTELLEIIVTFIKMSHS